MIKYAVIDQNGHPSGVVYDEVTQTISDHHSKYNQSLVMCKSVVKLEETLDGNTVTTYKLETFDNLIEHKSELTKYLHAKCNEKLAQLAKDYPERETQTWSVQLKEAEAYKLDSSAATPFITASLKDGETVDQYVDLIITNNTIWSQYAGSVVLLRRNYENSISNSDESTILSIQKEIESL